MHLRFRATTTLTISRLHRPQPSSSCSFDGSLKTDQLDCESKWPEVPPVLNQNEDRKRNKYLRKDYLKVWEGPDSGSILGATFNFKNKTKKQTKKMHEWHWSVVDEFLKWCMRGWEMTLSSSFSYTLLPPQCKKELLLQVIPPCSPQDAQLRSYIYRNWSSEPFSISQKCNKTLVYMSALCR